MRFVLRPRDGSATYHKITQGRNWVGRVYQHADTKLWHGIMYKGKYESHGHSTPEEAFRAVSSRALGFDSAEEVRAHNAQVRAQNRARKAEAQSVVDGVLRGDFTALDRLLGIKE